MKDFSKFATEEFPLRVSSISEFLQCNWKHLSKWLGMEQGSANIQAMIGTALHHTVGVFHEFNDKELAIKSLLENNGIFDAKGQGYLLNEEHLTEVLSMFRPYCEDKRNTEAKILGIEKYYSTLIPPHETDKTGEMITITGHVDQIRQEDRLLCCDIKTNAYSSSNLTLTHFYQLVFYAYLCNASGDFKELVFPGYLIMPRNYSKKNGTVFYRIPYKQRNMPIYLDNLRLAVANVRNRNISVSPEFWCNFCNYKSPVNCTDDLQQLRMKND